MQAKRAKLFVSHYPPDLAIYSHIVAMARVHDPNASILLYKVGHPYRFDNSPYKDAFDTIIEFPFIAYSKNILQGIKKIIKFKAQLRLALRDLNKFEHIDVYIEQSAWLPANAMLWALSKKSNVQHIYRITMGSYEVPGTDIYWLATWLCHLYRLFINVFPVYAIKRTNGGFATFRYQKNLPGVLVRFVNPSRKIKEVSTRSEHILRYPVFESKERNAPSDNVIVFGDTDFLDDFPDYVTDFQGANDILQDFFQKFETYYRNATLYYKPHPGAPDKWLRGMTKARYKPLPASLSAQAILEERWSSIRAAYTFFSTSVAWSSFFGIPSYTLYKLAYNNAGVERMDDVFEQPDITSPLIFPISNISEIGKIDAKKTKPHLIDLHHIPSNYRKILE